jgi:dimethylaniline monooxygenase (N-oxide forming)
MNAEQTLDYLHSYATHFGLHEHIQLNTRIQRVVPTPDDKRWEILILRNGKEQTIAFDKVVFCTGNTHTAKVPQIDGTETFRGRILHSQNFKR